jgi:hypothetical protein
VFDTRINSSGSISIIEDILYGSSTEDPHIPTVDDILQIVASDVQDFYVNEYLDAY